MGLNEYFSTAKGLGILSTADGAGIVDSAVYSLPYFPEEDGEAVIAFIMADHLSHSNVVENPHAAYLFIEEGEGFKGKRLMLTKIREETDPEKVKEVQRCRWCCPDETMQFVVYFKIDAIRPLLGGE